MPCAPLGRSSEEFRAFSAGRPWLRLQTIAGNILDVQYCVNFRGLPCVPRFAMRAYEIAAGSSTLEGLRRCERPDPSPLPHQILVRVKAASLNYRDLLIARGRYMGGTAASRTTLLSDRAGGRVRT